MIRESTTARLDVAPAVGDVLSGRYRLLEKIGQGGMGTVYKARHLKVDRIFAIKILSERGSDDAATLQRFEREAKVGGMLGGRHIVPVVDCAVTDGNRPYMVMEYVDGEDLSRILGREHVLSPRRAVNLVIDACRGLEIAHARGIVHRDLKPSNLLVSHEEGVEVCCVTDFGVAKVGSDAPTLKGQLSTETGALVGTVAYMAPEQIRGEEIDERADIFALGSILYEALSGSRLYSGASAYELMYQALETSPPHVCELQPNVPSELGEIVHRAIATAPGGRFGSARELARALAPFSGRSLAPAIEAESGSPTTSTELALLERPRRRSHRRVALASGLALALVGAVLWLALGNRPAPSPPAVAAGEPAAQTAPEPAATLPAAAKPATQTESIPSGPAPPPTAASVNRTVQAAPKARAGALPPRAKAAAATPPPAPSSIPRFMTSNPYAAER